MPFSMYQQGRIGSVTISPTRGLVAGTHEEISITYTAGDFGVDDTGAIKISWRSASDSSRPQISDAKAPNYTTAIASNGAVLQLEANRNNIRPWVGTLLVCVANGYLRKGDTITVCATSASRSCESTSADSAGACAFTGCPTATTPGA